MSFITSLSDWLRKISRSFASASISGQNITLTRHNGDTVVLTTQDTTYDLSLYAPVNGSTVANPLTRTTPDGAVFGFTAGNSAVTDYTEVVDVGFNHANRDGALLGLRSSSHATQPGYFGLTARDATNDSVLQGTPSGSLTWRNNKVITSIDIFTGATSSINGDVGIVPAPSAGDQYKCLLGDKTWSYPTYINTISASGNGARPVWFSYLGDNTRPVYNPNFQYNPATGQLNVGSINGYTIEKSVPSNAVFTDTVYSHPDTSGNKHVPSGGSNYDSLIWSADGTAAWGYPVRIDTTSGSANSDRHVFFAYDGDDNRVVYNDNFKYNPSTKNLVVEKINGYAITNVTTVPITFSSNVNAESAIAHCERIGRLVFFTFRVSFKNATSTWNGNAIMSGLPKRYASSPNEYYYGGCVADNLPLDGYTAPPSANSGTVYYVGRSVSVPANKSIGGWGCYIAAD